MAAAQICAKECSQGLIRQTMSAAQWAVPTWVPAEEFRSSDYKWDLFSEPHRLQGLWGCRREELLNRGLFLRHRQRLGVIRQTVQIIDHVRALIAAWQSGKTHVDPRDIALWIAKEFIQLID
jgi:hypothetical protein